MTLSNVNRAITFTPNSSGIGFANLSVPFPVKQFIVKQLIYTDDQNLSAYNTSNLLLSSDIAQYNTLGCLVSATSTSVPHIMIPQPDIRYTFEIPVSFSGSYRFVLTDLDGNAFTSATANTRVCVIIEFIRAT